MIIWVNISTSWFKVNIGLDLLISIVKHLL